MSQTCDELTGSVGNGLFSPGYWEFSFRWLFQHLGPQKKKKKKKERKKEIPVSRRGKQENEDSVGSFRTRPGAGICHFHPHSSDQISVVWLSLTARNSGKCDFSRCSERRVWSASSWCVPTGPFDFCITRIDKSINYIIWGASLVAQ